MSQRIGGTHIGRGPLRPTNEGMPSRKGQGPGVLGSCGVNGSKNGKGHSTACEVQRESSLIQPTGLASR